jgi:uracil-DNA glycosylase
MSMQPPTSLLPTSVKCAAILPPRLKILIVGEAPGESEARQGVPFVGASGKLLDNLLAEAGIRRYECGLTNVFDERPPGNSLAEWADVRKVAEKLVDQTLPWEPITVGAGAYVLPHKIQPALVRLRGEIERSRPNVIVCLGGTALTAVTGLRGISKYRGVFVPSKLVSGYKTIGTFHPSYLLQGGYEEYPTAIMDLMKALKSSDNPALDWTQRTLHVEPTITDLYEWQRQLLAAPLLAVDCETKPAAKQITCISFSPSRSEAFVVPFWSAKGHYWQTSEEEIIAWRMVKTVLEGPATKVLQNGMYDIQYFHRYRWYMRGFHEDTMLKHHALFPRMPKGLDFLGSLYCNERAWKRLRFRAGEEKRDA